MSLLHMHPPMSRRVALLRSSPEGEQAGGSGDDPRLIRLDGEGPDVHGLAAQAVADATRRVLRRHAAQALRIGPRRGIGPLRQWLAAHLAAQGFDVDARHVLITTGTPQALDLLGKVVLDPSSPLLVQRPTSAAALRAFAPYAPRLVGVPCDAQGPDARAFAAALPGARMAYLRPAASHPGGQALTPGRADELVAALREVACWLVEDEACGEMWFDAEPPSGLLARGAPHGVRVGTFSRLLFPGLCLGWVAGSAPLIERLEQARAAADRPSCSLSQWVLLDMLRDGVLERVLPALRDSYRERRDAMLGALARHMPAGVSWTRPCGGVSVWLTLPRHVDAQSLVLPAREHGVAIAPGGALDVGAGGCASFGNCWECRLVGDAEAAAPARNTVRLSLCAASPRAIETGVERLAQCLRQALRCEPRGWLRNVNRA